MKKYSLIALMLICLCGCKKVSQSYLPNCKITSADYLSGLLFVSKNNYQIETTAPATFSSADTNIQISSSGLIKRLTSAEVVTIEITWTGRNLPKTKLYALGATDDNQSLPFIKYQGLFASDVYGAYKQGWETLQKMPVKGETYDLILRHADADNGLDWSNMHNYPGPANWWKSPDNTIARQLNDQGIERSKELGLVLKDLNYNFKRIITSEFYRAVQTASLMNMGPIDSKDGRINNLAYNVYKPGIIEGLKAVIKEQPIDNEMTLIVTHHPVNEFKGHFSDPSFPQVSPFNWTGAYFIKVMPDKTICYQGAVSWAMFKAWRDLKLKK
ncbi:MAG: phosphohistidine phosphatase SixA [Mucilaginibacter sp.]|nr:phosphohistidine phosphatase SixA [Mucilaginibacter sp.]